MRIPVPTVILSIVVLVTALVLQVAAFQQQPTVQAGGGVIQPDVLAALETSSSVDVIVHLDGPALPPPGQINLAAIESATAQRQQVVLAGLTPADFTLTYQYFIVPALAGQVTQSGVDKLASDPNVLMVSLNTPVYLDLAESGPLVQAPAAHALGLDGADVNVAVIDSGIDATHGDLASSVIGEECFIQCPNGSDPPRQSGPGAAEHNPFNLPLEQRNGHGTWVSGIVTSDAAAAPLGIAPETGVFAYKIFGAAGSTGAGQILMALDHILGTTLQRDVQGLPPLTPIINMSLGDNNGWPAGTCRTDQPQIDQTIGNLKVFDVLTVVASGNNAYKQGISWPACSPVALSAGASYDADVGFSPYLVCVDATTVADQTACFSNSSNDLDVLAPGAVITSSWPGGGTFSGSGTSASAPHAAAVAALMKQAMPNLTPVQLTARMKLAGAPLTDQLNDANSSTIRWSPRVDARVALLTSDSADYDGDGCPNGKEFGPNPALGGQRNPLNEWDYFNPTQDGLNRVDDILAVIGQYFLDDDPFTPGQPPYAPGYNPGTDRTRLGANTWNAGPPNGQQRVDDILAAVGQYFHDCQ